MKKILLILLAVVVFSCENTTTDYSISGNDNYPAPDKICALTFDDGPDTTKTALMLDELDQWDAVATFFLIGEKIDETTAPVINRAIEMGCEIGNHSWSYSSLDTMTAQEIQTSIDDTNTAIQNYSDTEVDISFFRPPNLATSATMFETIPYPFMGGIAAYDWNRDTAQVYADNILNNSNLRDGAVILMHDVQSHDTHGTLDVLIPELKKLGYEFVTLSELFDQQGVDPASRNNIIWTVVE